jgi:hypothetical protein
MMTTTATRRTRKTASSKADGSLNLATGELKVGPAKKTTKKAPAKKAVPAHVKKQAAEMEALEASGKPKKDQTFEERDWTYLDDKDPSEQHVLFTKEINRRVNLEEPITPDQVQAVLAMFPHFQRSATNKNRSGYKPLNEAIVEKRSEHMKLAHQEARQIMDGLAATATKKTAKAPATKKVAAKAPAKAATKKAAQVPESMKMSPTVHASKKAAPAKKVTTRKSTPANPRPAEAATF